MYQQFFGFNTLPFKITPDERVFFAGAHRQEMLDALLYGVERGEGIITVIGEVGIGKTTLARVLSNRFSDCFFIMSIFTPNVSSSDMLRLIAQEAGLNPPALASKVELMQLIRAYCLQLHQQGRRFLLLIDEAQTMLVETIEELRLLSNMQVDDITLVQVLLFGQSELDRMLNSPELRQVKDRVVFQIHIEPFGRDELADYLAFRLQQAGYTGQHFFSDAVIDAIYRKSQGYARAVNRLADQALMAAFAEQTHQVGVDHVESSNQEAIQPLAIAEPARSIAGASQLTHQKAYGGVAVASIALLAVVAWFVWEMSQFSHSPLMMTGQKTDVITAQVKPEVELASTLDNGAVRAEISPTQNAVVSSETNLASSHQQSPFVAEQPVHQRLIVGPVASAERWLKAGKTDEDWQQIHQQQLRLFRELAAEEKYTIQLMSSPWRLRESFVREVSTIMVQLPKAPAFYYDYSGAPERPRIAAIYGVYESKESAKQALNILAEMNKGYRPEMTSYKQVFDLTNKSQVLMERSR